MQNSTLVKFAAAALSATVLVVPAFAADTIKLGVAGPHTGDLAAYGLPTKEAVEMVVADVNANGGVNGKQVELMVMDDQCKPEIATNVATKLVSEGVNIVIGHVCSGATKAAMGIYNGAKVIAISPSATNPPLTKSGEYPNFYRTIAPDDEQGALAAAFVIDKLKAKKIAIIHDKGDYGKGFADFAKEDQFMGPAYSFQLNGTLYNTDRPYSTETADPARAQIGLKPGWRAAVVFKQGGIAVDASAKPLAQHKLRRIGAQGTV